MHFYTIQYFFKIRNELPKMFVTVNAMECDYLKRQLRGKEVCEHVLSITHTHTHTHTRARACAHSLVKSWTRASLLECKSWLCHLLIICMALGKLYNLYFSVSFVKWQ